MSGNRAVGPGRPTGMRRVPIALVFTLVLVSCASSEPSDTGRLTGVVTAGPTCPVETVASPCPPVPWEGTVRATADDGSTFETETDPQGAFSLDLPAGSYVVIAVTPAGGPPTAVPLEVTTIEGQTLHVDLEVDTGIR